VVRFFFIFSLNLLGRVEMSFNISEPNLCSQFDFFLSLSFYNMLHICICFFLHVFVYCKTFTFARVCSNGMPSKRARQEVKDPLQQSSKKQNAAKDLRASIKSGDVLSVVATLRDLLNPHSEETVAEFLTATILLRKAAEVLEQQAHDGLSLWLESITDNHNALVVLKGRELPSDLFLLITSFATACTQAMAECVCQSWKKILRHPHAARILQPSLDPFPFPCKKGSDFTSFLSNPRWNYTTRMAYPLGTMSHAVANAIYQHLPQLKHLDLGRAW
jgi:hypothetical protein